MKLLLDECLPRRLKSGLPDHRVKTVPEMGWAGIKNGQLLPLVEAEFDVFITIDGNLRYQQNVSGRQLALVVLSTLDNTLETLLPLMPQGVAALPSLQPEQIVKISEQPETASETAHLRVVIDSC